MSELIAAARLFCHGFFGNAGNFGFCATVFGILLPIKSCGPEALFYCPAFACPFVDREEMEIDGTTR
jgi:hypothetical protein